MISTTTPAGLISHPYQKYADTRFFASLDGLRALSILGVVWAHNSFGTPAFDSLQSIPLLNQGHFGVYVFFAISGFLITTLLLRERAKFGSISLRNFYLRRALRIWPLYYAVLALYILLTLLLERRSQQGHEFFHYLPTYLTYTYTWFGPRSTAHLPIFNFAWSLSAEEQFYLFWPLALVFLRRPWPLVALLALIALKLTAFYGLLRPLIPADSLAQQLAVSLEIPICLGALLALTLHHPRGFHALFPVLGHKSAAPAALILLVLTLLPNSNLWWPLAWLTLPLLVGACVIREDHALAPLLRFRPLAFIGVVSYGIYLLNTLVIKALRPLLAHAHIRHPLLAFPFTLAASVFVAWLSFRYFESPFLKLKHRFSRLTPPPSTLAPDAIPVPGTGPRPSVNSQSNPSPSPTSSP